MENNNKLYGAILGDLIGKIYEYNYKGDFSEFNIHDDRGHISDDSLLTLATAGYMIGKYNSFEQAYLKIGLQYNDEKYGYGKGFRKWLECKKAMEPSFDQSYGNGCLMRVSPCAYYSDYNFARKKALESVLCSHSHPISLIAVMELMELYREAHLRKIAAKYHPEDHIEYARGKFMVEADNTIELVSHLYWISNSTHKTIEQTIKLGGDTDTNASIVGELMNYTFNDLTKKDVDFVESKLDNFQLSILREFNKKFN